MDYMVSLGYEVHAISLPGHGKSSLAKGRINKYSIQDYVDCMSGEIAKVSPPPVVIAHSMGGLLTMKYLESKDLPGAVLMGSFPKTGVLPLIFRLLRIDPWSSLKAALTLKIVIPTPENARKLFLSPDTNIDLEEFFGQLCPDSVKASFEMVFKIRPRTEVINTPALVIAGEKDACFSVEEERRLAEALNAKFIVMPGQAHDLMLEPAWKDMADEIDRWITAEMASSP